MSQDLNAHHLTAEPVPIQQETSPRPDLARDEDSAHGDCSLCRVGVESGLPGASTSRRGTRRRGHPQLGGGPPPPGILRGSEARASARIRRRGALPPSQAAGALLAVPAAGRAACKMSVRRGERPARPGTRLSWLLCCSALLSPAAGYVIVSSVSWAVTNEVDEELDSASTEEALPALLEDSGSIWQQSFPASAHKEDAHLPPPAGAARARPPPAPPGMFSYPRESGPRLRPGTARFLAHASAWGCLATVSAHEKVSRPAAARGRCMPRSGLALRRRAQGPGSC